MVTIPPARRKTRQSFDIFADQYDALKKIQLAEADRAEHQHSRKMGDMVQEALDAFIVEKARNLGTISIRRSMSNRTPQFQGFYVPNSTQVPDTLFDELMADLSGAELKVVLYIIRRTFGFKRQSDTI